MDEHTAVLLDLDGTLVDSVYHHVLAWDHALRAFGFQVPHARIHAAIGLGSDRLIPWLLGEHPTTAAEISEAHDGHFLDAADALIPTPGARILLDDLETREVPFVIATSAGGAESDSLLGALDRTDLPLLGSDDVGSSKPSPAPLLAAAEHLPGSPDRVLLVGDSPWDARAAARAGIEPVAVRTGGFSTSILTDAGAAWVVDAPIDLIGLL